MKIRGSQGLNKASCIRNADHTQTATEKNPHSKLTRNLTKVFNDFLEIKLTTPLTIETLDQVQLKFCPSPDNFFCEELWNACKADVNKITDSCSLPESLSSVIPGKKPVVFSSREGLDIVLQLHGTLDELKVNSLLVNPGGSSINVARALSGFDCDFDLVGMLGNGGRSEVFAKTLMTEWIDPATLLKVDGDTRMHFSTSINGNEYWIVSDSPLLNGDLLSALTEKLFESCRKNQKKVLALANSEPNGASEMYMPEIIEITKDKYGMFVIYDTKLHGVRKEVVDAVLKKGPDIIKPNLAEFCDLVGIDESTLRTDRDQIVHFAKEMISKYGIKMILVSMDKDGGILVDKKRAVYAGAPDIKVVSPGCAGDTGIAAMIDRAEKEEFRLSRLSDDQMKKILSAFIAGGAATASKPGSCLGTLDDVISLEKEISVENL